MIFFKSQQKNVTETEEEEGRLEKLDFISEYAAFLVDTIRSGSQ